MSDEDDDAQDPDMEPFADIQPSQGRTAPLQRRSQVLSQAAQAGNGLPEPSAEMIAYLTSRDEDDDAGVPSGRGQNKRLHADLTPLSEEGSDFAEGPSSRPSTSRQGRQEPAEMQPRRSTRRTKMARMS